MNHGLDDQATVISRILDHIDAGTTDLGEAVWREPVSHYVSPEHFAAEVERVLRRTATPFCPSAALPEPGCYVARDAAFSPIVAVRDRDGDVQAFRNACRHRGAQVVPTGSGRKAALTCRYHAWSYGLDGTLRGIPHDDGFPCLNRGEHGLVPVTTVEQHGIVYVTQDGDAAVEETTPELLGPQWQVIDVNEQEIDANWKIVTEGVLEGYHIRSTHAETFYPRQYDNLTLVEAFGRNTRVTFPYQNIERLRQTPAGERRTRGVLTHVYHLFPNAAVATFPTHRTLTIFEPLQIDRTRLVSYQLIDRTNDAVDQTTIEKGRSFVTTGTDEDREMQTAVQRGLAARANEFFTFGLFEGGISRLHKHLAEALAG